MDQNLIVSLVGAPALVETGSVESTGLVSGQSPGALVVSCDEFAWAGGDPADVTVSVFAEDALYRFSGPCELREREVVVPDGILVERVQRRKWPRRRFDFAATLCPVDDTHRVSGVPGRTVDVGSGGLCVETLRPLEVDKDPTVILTLPDGRSISVRTTTVEVEDLGDGWRYRLAFSHLEPRDAALLVGLFG